MRLSKAIQEIKTCHKGLKMPEKKVDAVTQRKNASLEKKLNSEDLSQGWSKENFLKMWKDNWYVFKLSQQTPRRCETNYILERNDTLNKKRTTIIL